MAEGKPPPIWKEGKQMFDMWFWFLCGYAVVCLVACVVLLKKYRKIISKKS